MKKLFVFILIAMMIAQTALGSENMIYDMIGNEGRVLLDAQLLAAPDDSADVICSIPARNGIVIIGEMGNYFLVNFDGKSGYIDGSVIDFKMGIGGITVYEKLTAENIEKINAYIAGFIDAGLAVPLEGSIDTHKCDESVLVRYAVLSAANRGERADLTVSDVVNIVESLFDRTVDADNAASVTESVEIPEAFRETNVTITAVNDMQNGKYEVKFCFDDGEENRGYGFALISAEDIADCDTYKLLKLTVSQW